MTNMEVYYQSVVNNLIEAAKTNRFSSKEEMNKYIQGLKQRGIPESVLNNEKIVEILGIYDEHHKVEETVLDMENYKNAALENSNYIVATQDDTVLKTDTNSEEMKEEFKEKQNELSTDNKDGLATADEVYQKLKNDEKEEETLLPISEAINKENISTEILNKIKFFITNKYINPYSYKVSPETGIFYNVETKELLEVRINPETNEYQIFKGGEAIYKDEKVEEEKEEENMTDREEQTLQNELNKPKVRRLIKPPANINNQAAFVKVSFLSLAMISLAVILSIVMIAIKK